MQVVYFFIVAVALYWASSRILSVLEARRGAHLEHRSLVFFAILLSLALITFWLIRRFAPA
jgi:hypothetical protein